MSLKIWANYPLAILLDNRVCTKILLINIVPDWMYWTPVIMWMYACKLVDTSLCVYPCSRVWISQTRQGYMVKFLGISCDKQLIFTQVGREIHPCPKMIVPVWLLEVQRRKCYWLKDCISRKWKCLRLQKVKFSFRKKIFQLHLWMVFECEETCGCIGTNRCVL